MTIRWLPARVSLSALAAGFLISGCSDDTSRPNTPPADAAPLPDGPPPDAPQPPGVLQIKTLSNRADLVSGGDVLVEIVIPAGSPDGALHVKAGDADVSDRFVRAGTRAVGLVTGLAESPTGAPTVITADIGGAQKASLMVTNHPIGGPVFSGPQITPWVCALPLGKTPTATDPGAFDNGLGQPPTDAQCNAPTLVKLYYRTTANPPACSLAIPDPSKGSPAGLASPPPEGAATPPTNPCFKPYDSASPPSDIAMTTTDAGVTVPYIVQVERGTLNRGIYDVAVLIDPTQGSWKPTAPNRAWNRKLLYLFGASTNQPRFQQRSSQQWSGQDDALKRGFMVAMNNLTDSNLNSNRVSMTETLMMMREHIVDTYGELRFAMGAGCSGGSINQLTASSIFPGLLDGIQPSCTYPDSETTSMEVADCELLVRVYASDAWKALVPEAERAAKQKAINGHFDDAGCRSWFNSFSGRGRPGQYDAERANANGTIDVLGRINNCGLPEDMVYEPTLRPSAPRCTPQDHAASIWGQVPGPVDGTFHAPTTRDNVGVVYGRQAFLDKVISQEEFVLLNERVGGSNFDINHTDARSVADSSALEIAYKSGIVMDGHQLRKTPILDVRGFDEPGIHFIWRSFSLRARLDAAGGHGNHVLWRFPTALTPPAASGLTLQSFLAMDKWLTTLRGDTSAMALEQRVVTDKPAEGFDFCYLAIDTAFTLKITDPAICDLDPRLRANRSPRQVAGGPVTENILKCQLKPFNAADYPGLDDDRRARLAAVFPDGVCDWTKPGIGQQDAQSPRDFSGGPGGAALPAAPVSKAAE